jgi:hypothetical protein
MTRKMVSTAHRHSQPSLFDPGIFVADAVERLSASGAEERGAVFTRREVVEFILDLIGYTADKDLSEVRMLEPSFGGGDFLGIIIERLMGSWKRRRGMEIANLFGALVAVEVHRESFTKTKKQILGQLEAHGVSREDAAALANAWLHQGDFLLKPIAEGFDFVVGNPPYVRQEMIPNELLFEYRRQFRTMYDRADIYIPFIEKALLLLKKNGALSFICSDRWMKNRYGGPLRELVTRGFHLKVYVDMVGTPAFTSDVIAYPAITVIVRDKGSVTRVAHRPEVSEESLSALAARLNGSSSKLNGSVQEIQNVTSGSEPWLLEADGLEGLGLVRRLESQFPTLEEAGCKVGIGVATGADRVFIGPIDELDVEPSRKIPLVMTRDIEDGSVKWRGLGVVNPFADDGKLVRLEDFPRLKSHFEKHGKALKERHVAKKNSGAWYRTIDKITPSIARMPKLLIPDIKGDAHIVFEKGLYYPHHNLYYITSTDWDLRALQAVLMSGIAKLFVSTYSTKMRGGCFRFQAQYLRRIRVPEWRTVSEEQRKALIGAVKANQAEACNEIVAGLYKLSRQERKLIEGD